MKEPDQGNVYIQDDEKIMVLNIGTTLFSYVLDFKLSDSTLEGVGATAEVRLFDALGKPGFYVPATLNQESFAFSLSDVITPDLRLDWVNSIEKPTFTSDPLEIDIYTDYMNPGATTADALSNWSWIDSKQVALFSVNDDRTETRLHKVFDNVRTTTDETSPNYRISTEESDWDDHVGDFYIGVVFNSQFKSTKIVNLPGSSVKVGKVYASLFDTNGGKILVGDNEAALPLTTAELSGEGFTGRKVVQVQSLHSPEGHTIGFRAQDTKKAQVISLTVELEIQED